MRDAVSIEYSPDSMCRNKLRFERHYEYRYADRVPVLFGVFARSYLKEFGIDFDEYFRSAETQFHWQLKFQKWAIENIPDDRCQDPVITVGPDFENVLNTSAFGGHVEWRAENPPRARPTIHQPDQVGQLRIPEIDEGFWAKYVSWWQTMTDLARETDVTFNGQPGRVAVAPLGIQWIGPHMMAIDLVGDDFYWWMLEYPEACHQLLDTITSGLIHAETRFRQIDPHTPRPNFAVAEDSAQIMSAELFRQFCVPYDNRLYAFNCLDTMYRPASPPKTSAANATCGETSIQCYFWKAPRRKSVQRRQTSWRLWGPATASCWAMEPMFAPEPRFRTSRRSEIRQRNTRGKIPNCLPSKDSRR